MANPAQAILKPTPITKSPVPAKPTPTLSKGQTAATLKAFGAFTGKPPAAPTVSTQHPALEPSPPVLKVPTPAYGGASSRAPKTTKGLEPHAKLPPVPAPSTVPIGPKGLTGLKPSIQPGPPVSKPTAAQLTKNWGGDPVVGAVNSLVRKVTSGGLVTPTMVGSPSLKRAVSADVQASFPKAAQAVSGAARDVRNTISKTAGFKQERPSSGLPGATISSASLGPEALSWAASGAQQAINTPAEILPSGVFAAEAAVAAAQGNLKPAEDLGKQIGAGFTTYQGLKANWLNDLLMVRGGVGAAGHLAYPALKEIGLAPKDLSRPDIVPYGKARVPQLDYSKNPVTRLEQKIQDAGRSTRTRINMELARQTSDLYGMHSTRWRSERIRIEQERQQAITGRRTRKGQVRQLGTHLANPTEPTGLISGPEIAGKEATNAVIQGIVLKPETALADLQKYRDKVAQVEHPAGSDAEKVQAATLGHLDGLIHSSRQGKIDWNETIASAHKTAGDLNAYQAPLVARGIVNPAAAERTPLTTFMSLHMEGERGLTPQALAHDVAKRAVGDAQKHLNVARESLDAAGTLAERQAAGLVHAMTQKELEGARAREKTLDVPAAERAALLHTSSDYGGRPGEVITNDEARNYARELGVDPNKFAYITHKPLAAEPVRWSGMKGHPLAESKRRTMTAFQGGLIDLTHDAVVNQHLKSAMLIHKHDFTQAVINRFVLRKGGTALPVKGQPHGDFKTFGEAQGMATDPAFRKAHGVPEGVNLVPFRITEPFMRKAQMTTIKGDLATHEATFSNENFGTGDHNSLDTGSPGLSGLMPTEVKGASAIPGSEPGPWGLIAQTVAKRLIQHEQPESLFMRVGGSSRSLFARSVLPFSPKRPLGELQETGMRMFGGRAGATSIGFLHQQFKTMEKGGPAAQREVENIVAANWGGGGGLAGQAVRARKFVTNTQYAGTRFERIPDAIAHAKAAPVIGEAIRGFNATINGIMHVMSKGEAVGMKAGTGKYFVKLLEQETGTSWTRALRLDQRARMDFAQRYMMNSDHQLASMRYTGRMMGKWSNHSPHLAQALTWAPFASWYLNSLQFMYAVLPHDHPVLTGMLAAANTGTQQQRAAVGLSGPLSLNPLEVPGYQEGGVPIGGGKEYQASYYSPDPVTDPLQSLASQIAPVEVGGLILPALGVDYTGRVPKNAQGKRVPLTEAEKIKLAFMTLLGEQVPGFQFAQTVTSRPQSFVAPPLRIYKMYPAAKQAGGSSGYGTGTSYGGSYSGGSYSGGYTP